MTALAAVLSSALLLAAPPSRAELARRGDAICRAGETRLVKAYDNLLKAVTKERGRNAKPTTAELTEFVGTNVVPEIDRQLAALAGLPVSPNARAALAQAVATGRRELAVLRADPAKGVGSTSPFPTSAAQFRALGFKECGQG